MLAREKLELGAIRSLLEDDRFVRYVKALTSRYEATVGQMDSIPATESIMISELHGVRKVYRHELTLIKTSSVRIKVIDEELAILNKERKINNNRKGNEGISNIVPPKERSE